ncbi:MAG TPA: DoxX family membrane protein [Terriglobales bacterium]|nr:DoxX family membrane protein [Terriglobales bacterium]
MKDRWLAYAIFRLALGINIFIHGTVRIFGPGAHGFASSTAKTFHSTPLPFWAVYGFLFVLPFLETVLGCLVAIGLFTRWSLVAGGLLIAILIFGTALQSDWPTVGVQMIYSMSYFALLYHLDQNAMSLDAFRTRIGREQ